MGEVEERILAANGLLSKVRLRVRGEKLYIQGTFPPKPGEYKAKQREIPTGCNATPAQIKVALAKAKGIDSQLLLGTFDWSDYAKNKPKSLETVADWVERCEASHWERTERNPTTERSFETGYGHYFRQLPKNEPLTLDLLRKVILSKSEPATRSRQMYCMAYRKLAALAARQGAIARDELDVFERELRELRTGYKPKQREIPTDEEIIEIWQGIKNSAWRWVYGVMATYGIRPHEIFHLDLERFTQSTEALGVFNTTKTGERLAYPCPVSWRERFELWDYRLPKIQTEGKSNEWIGKKISQEFRELRIPHTPYALRHAWCIRTIFAGVPDSVAAKWAGHSVSVHVNTYHKYISQVQHQQVFEEMKRRELEG